MNPLPPLDPNLAVTYWRVSSADQEKATGPERQRRNIRSFAKRTGLQIVAEHGEDISGTKRINDRPELLAALVSARALGAGVLIVDERTRLERDEYAAHEALHTFAAAGVVIRYADGSNGAGTDENAGLLLDAIGHAVAAYERRVIVARLAAGRQIKAAEQPHDRKQGGRLPHGYRRDAIGSVEIDPQAAAEVQRVFAMVRGGKSIRQAAEVMEWRPTVVARILSRDIYKRANPGRIVSPAVWNGAQAALAARRKRASV